MSTGMLTMAAPSSTGGTPAVVTDGGGAVDVRHTIPADMGGNLVASATACTAPERDDLCGHAYGRHG